MKKVVPLLAFLLFTVFLKAQTPLWGMANQGGTFNEGTIFGLNYDGSNFNAPYSFANYCEGTLTYTASPTLSSVNGKLYGVAFYGGSGGVDGYGVVYSYDPSTGISNTVWQFAGGLGGQTPTTSLTEYTNGKLYGSTDGGELYPGIIFSIDPSNNDLFTIEYEIGTQSSDLGGPSQCPLVLASNGIFYGVVGDYVYPYSGIFTYDPTGSSSPDPYYNTVYTFSSTYDQNITMIVQDPNPSYSNFLYGVNSGAGNPYQFDGYIFCFNISNNTLNTVYTFPTPVFPATGPYPINLVYDNTYSRFYGVASSGPNADGIIFSFTPTDNSTGGGSYAQEIDFYGTGLSSVQTSGLTMSSNGSIYGATQSLSSFYPGYIYEFTPSATPGAGSVSGVLALDTVQALYYQAENVYGAAGTTLTEANGALYGLGAQPLGLLQQGTMFSFNETTGAENTVINFTGGGSSVGIGSNPMGGLTQATNGLFYGTTTGQGQDNEGVIFSYDFKTNNILPLYSFSYNNGYDGINPTCNLVEDASGNLYGVTTNGSAYALDGVIFSYNVNTGSYNDLFAFDGGTSGGNPVGSLVLVNGTLYGLASTGGLNNDGVLFSYNLGTSTYTPLYSLNSSTDGGSPTGTLLLAADGVTLYGTTTNGGANSYGEIFSYNIATSTFGDLYAFDGTHGSSANGSLVQPVGGILYGTTSTGGAYGYGVIFSYDSSSNTYSDVIDFSGSGGSTSGAAPNSGMVYATNGNLYGATTSGGANGAGEIFSYNIVSNTYTPLHDLVATNDGSPVYGPLNTVSTYWTAGDNSTEWADPLNWTTGVPSSTLSAVIPVNANSYYPQIDEATASVGNLTIQSGASVTVTSGYELDIYGNLVNDGLASLGAGNVVFAGSGLQAITGISSLVNCTINNSNGVIVAPYNGNSLIISGVLTLESGNLTANGKVTLTSSSSSSVAMIDNFSNVGYTGTISGNINAQRAYDASEFNNQHLFGSPVSGQGMGQLMTQLGVSPPYNAQAPGYLYDPNCDYLHVDPTSPYSSIQSYNESASNASSCALEGWYAETSGTLLVPQGYSFGGPDPAAAGSFVLTGIPNLASSYTLSSVNNGGTTSELYNSNYLNYSYPSNNESGTAVPQYSGYNLASNPYSATLAIGSNSDQSTNDATFGSYVYVLQTEGSNVGTYQPTTTVAPFQAFMVNITNAYTTGDYVIYGVDRSLSPTQFERVSNPTQLKVTATNTASKLTDVTRVAFNTNATAQYDPLYDAYKIVGASNRHTLYTLIGDRWMSINTRPSIAETPTVPMGIMPGVSGSYTFTFDGLSSFDPTTYITLEDKQLNVMYDVRNGAYAYTSDAGTDDWNRFVLHFTPPALINTTNATCSAQGMINIQQPGTASWSYSLTNNSNTVLSSGSLNSGSPVTASVPTGVYTLTLVDNSGYTVVKNIQVNGDGSIAASFDASATSVQQNEEVSFTAIATGATSYNWNFGDETTGAGATAAHAYPQPGVYNVTLLAADNSGCTSSSVKTIHVNAGATGINTVSGNNSLAIWSNDNKIYVDFTKAGAVQATVTVYDIIGQEMYHEKVADNILYTKEIDNIEAGYVVVNVMNGDQVITRKLFIANSK